MLKDPPRRRSGVTGGWSSRKAVTIGTKTADSARIPMCDVAGRTTSRASGTACNRPAAAACSSPPPRSRDRASACSGRTASASPMMIIVRARIARSSSSPIS
ncbi:hypothetical protein [Microlunatus speluncae]|uniref:hypothetical protein n=1 Tax=Microlunatus speluncae TaxID=2594267 RepID=UPI00137561F7|nr:hypothetical protein [Microlunatus speluncae]